VTGHRSPPRGPATGLGPLRQLERLSPQRLDVPVGAAGVPRNPQHAGEQDELARAHLVVLHAAACPGGRSRRASRSSGPQASSKWRIRSRIRVCCRIRSRNRASCRSLDAFCCSVFARSRASSTRPSRSSASISRSGRMSSASRGRALALTFLRRARAPSDKEPRHEAAHVDAAVTDWSSQIARCCRTSAGSTVTIRVSAVGSESISTE
jgi:hypothetical protein